MQICQCKPWSFGLTWQFLHDQHHLQKRWRWWCQTDLTPHGHLSNHPSFVHVFVNLPVAQRAMKVWTCLRISASLSSGSGSLLTMCSMKSFGVTAARFHFNFPNTTSSHSWEMPDTDRKHRQRSVRMRVNQVTSIPTHTDEVEVYTQPVTLRLLQLLLSTRRLRCRPLALHINTCWV